MEKKGLSKIIIQSIFIIVLLVMFVVDKIFNMVSPPLQDYWYAITCILAIGVEPHQILDFYKTYKGK